MNNMNKTNKEKGKEPIEKFWAGNVSATIWGNESKTGQEFISVTLDKVFTGKDGKPANTNCLNENEVDQGQQALRDAQLYLLNRKLEQLKGNIKEKD